MEKQGYIYILGSQSLALYIGVTSNLLKRMYEHKQHIIPGFTDRYNITKLLYYEVCEDMYEAISREKQLKGWRRSKKIALIESKNPFYKDLAFDWHDN